MDGGGDRAYVCVWGEFTGDGTNAVPLSPLSPLNINCGKKKVSTSYNNNNNERISRAPFQVKHAQLRWTGANIEIQNI